MEDSGVSPVVPSDEISLRDLYLIIRRNLHWLVIVPVAVAIITFVVVDFRPPVYESSATTVVTPPPIEIESDRGITFKPSVDVAFESYESVAMSEPVAAATLEILQNSAQLPAETVEDMTPRSLTGSFSLEQLTGPDSTGEGTPLSVVHSVSHGDPLVAATVANVWAQESLRVIKSSLLDTLSPVDETTEREIAGLAAELEAAESALERFDASNNLSLQRLRVEQLAARLTSDELELDSLTRQLEVSEARRQVLEAQLADELGNVTTSDPLSDTYLAGLSLEEARQFLTEQRELVEQERQAAQAELDAFDREHNLSILAARIDNYQSVVANGEVELNSLRDQAEILSERRDVLEQQLDAANLQAESTDALSNRFMSGLTLAEANEFVTSQLERATAQQQAARESLDAFDRENNLALLQARIDELNAKVTARESRLDEIPGELAILSERMAEISTQLAQQPLSLQLQDVITASPLLSEAARSNGELLDALAGTQLEREQMNPAHFELVSELTTAAVRERALETELEVLIDELEQARSDLQAARQTLIDLQTQRTELALAFDQANEFYRQARARGIELDYAELDPRASDRKIRASYDAVNLPPELQIQDQLREVERELGDVNSRIAVLQARLAEAEELLPRLRDQQILLTAQRQLLAEELNRATQSFGQVEAKLADFRRGALDPRADRSLRNTTPEVLQIQSDLREVEVSVRATEAGLASLQEQILEDEPRLARMQEQLTALETQRNQLERQMANAQQAYQDVAQLGPTIAYVTQLAPTTARVLSSAPIPLEPVDSRAPLISVIAALVAGMIVLLFIFLSEAVREPAYVGKAPDVQGPPTVTSRRSAAESSA